MSSAELSANALEDVLFSLRNHGCKTIEVAI